MKQAEIKRWRKAADLLPEILDQVADDQQAAVQALGAAHNVAAELQSLYSGSMDVSILDQALENVLKGLPAPEWPRHALKGQVMGQWVLGNEIGRGGMSVIYEARRQSPDFDQNAALKILTVGSLGEDFVASFLRERQILSDLQHPGISRLIDGGITPDGAPFLVMQWIDGQRIDQWCRERHVGLATLTRLMLKLCDAVDYAQHQLVVHQDINPSNVLIDEHGQPVLIDFGIARLLDSASGERTLRLFTPRYAAPEQLRGEAITTATDVYALGRLFLFLLDGKVTDKDLNLILEVATREEPSRRYRDVGELRADLLAWQDKRPISVRAPSLAYRAERFVTRNRWGVAAAVILSLSVIAGLVSSAWQARIAAAERDQARLESARAAQVTAFLKDLFKASDPDQSGGETVTARALLDQGAHQVRIGEELAPDLRTELLILLGELYRELGELDVAGSLLEEGLERAGPGGDAALQASARRALAAQRMEVGRHDEALQLAEEGEEILERDGAVPGDRHAALTQPLLFSLTELGRAAEAVERGKGFLALIDKHIVSPEARFQYLYNVANVLLIAEQADEAKVLLRQAAAIESDIVDEPSNQMSIHSNLAGILAREGDLDGSLEHYQEAVRLAEALYQPGHPERARKLSNLASVQIRLGQFEEAEHALLESLEIYRSLYPDTVHPRLAAAHNNLGRVYQMAGDLEAAEPHISLAREMALSLFGRDDTRFAIATANLGLLQLRLGRLDQADRLLSEHLELRRIQVGDEHRSVGQAKAMLAALRLEQHRPQEALEFTDDALALFARINYQSPAVILTTRLRRARALADLGHETEAQAAFLEAIALGEEVTADAGTAWPELLAAYAEFLLSQDAPRADKALARALSSSREILGPDHPETLRLETLSATPSPQLQSESLTRSD